MQQHPLVPNAIRKADGSPFTPDELVEFAADPEAVRRYASENLAYLDGKAAAKAKAAAAIAAVSAKINARLGTPTAPKSGLGSMLSGFLTPRTPSPSAPKSYAQTLGVEAPASVLTGEIPPPPLFLEIPEIPPDPTDRPFLDNPALYFNSNFSTTMFQNQFGADNPFLLFRGDKDELVIIGSENPQQKQITLTLANASTTDARTARIFAGYTVEAGLATGVMTDGAFNDISGGAGLSATVSGSVTIKQLREYLRRKPTVLKEVRLASTVAAQLSQAFEIKTIDVWKSPTSRFINPDDHIRAQDTNDKLVYFPFGEVISDEKEVFYTVQPSTSVTLKFYFGHSFSVAYGAEAIFKRAYNAAKLEGVHNLRAALEQTQAQHGGFLGLNG